MRARGTPLAERTGDKAVIFVYLFGGPSHIDTYDMKPDGRDHWPRAGFGIFAGGGPQTGQVIGRTDKHGSASVGQPYTPQNTLATLYRHLGIDPVTTFPDHTGRPMYLLDNRDHITELG